VFVFCLLITTKDLGENLSPNPIQNPGRFAAQQNIELSEALKLHKHQLIRLLNATHILHNIQLE
jgi:hypothetical protein